MKKASKAGGTKTAGIGDAAVREATGKSWEAWFDVLDAAGAKSKDHRGIAAILEKRRGLSGWWCQMLTVGYEQARGLRRKHETPAGFQVSGSKTVAAPLGALFRMWHDPTLRKRWLKDAGFLVRKATRDKSMRITWVDGKTSVEVNFYAKGTGKSLVALQHGKLSNAAAASKMKAYWSRQLARLAEAVGGTQAKA
jgi:hypothetical protein